MKPWTRTPMDWADDPSVNAFAEELRISVMAAIGHLLCVWSKMPEFACDGDFTSISPMLLEQWARWRGRKATFDDAFRKVMLDQRGVWAIWEELNGAVLREKSADAKRAADRRRLIKEAKEKQLDAFAETTAAAIEKSPPDGPADGPALRTDVPTTTTGSARARNGNGLPGQFPARGFRPGDANLPAQAPWCAECGEGVPAHLVGGKRGERYHHDDCSRRPTPALQVPA